VGVGGGHETMTASTDELLTERKGNVQWIIFNRPESRNALTWHMYDRLVEACQATSPMPLPPCGRGKGWGAINPFSLPPCGGG
jgi:hypothetical protein